MPHLHLVDASTPDNERPTGITCTTYVRGEGKRCLHYAPSGRCLLPDHDVCSEWLKHNSAKPPSGSSARALPLLEPTSSPPELRPRDRFGAPAVPTETRPKAKAPAHAPRALGPAPNVASAIDVDQLRGFTTEDIASFKAFGVEVRMFSEAHGEFWLVPAYTDKPRFEITPEHAATVMRVLSLFPGAHLVAFEKKKPQQERPERPETRS